MLTIILLCSSRNSDMRAKDKLLPHKPPLMSALLWFFPKLGVGERGLNFIFITNTRHSLAVTQLSTFCVPIFFFFFFVALTPSQFPIKKRERKLLGYTRTSYIKSIYIYIRGYFFPHLRPFNEHYHLTSGLTFRYQKTTKKTYTKANKYQ